MKWAEVHPGLAATGFVLLVTAALVAVVVPIKWFSAGAQSAVYRRNGIEITQSELFWGAEPPIEKRKPYDVKVDLGK